MKRRTKKYLSLLLVLSMMMSLNFTVNSPSVTRAEGKKETIKTTTPGGGGY